MCEKGTFLQIWSHTGVCIYTLVMYVSYLVVFSGKILKWTFLYSKESCSIQYTNHNMASTKFFLKSLTVN